jgi:hypothetical protein
LKIPPSLPFTKGGEDGFPPLKKGDQGGFYGDSFDFLGFKIHFSKG